MSGWWEALLAMAVFLLSHSIPARAGLRDRLVGQFGRAGYLTLYSLISLVLLVWLIVAIGRAPYVPLWPFATWQLWVPLLVMPFVCLLAALGLAVPNPLSLGGLSQGFDPDRPGIVGITRHPLLWAFALWAVAHALAKGDLAHLFLFGGFALFSILGAWVIDRRRRRQLGHATWRELARNAPFLPFGRLGATRLSGWPLWPSALRGGFAVLLFAALLVLHEPVIGLWPLPPGLTHG